MHYQPTRRVAIVGSLRIPFCRAHTRYAEASNQDMMTAVLQGLVERYRLAGERLGDVSLGAVMKHSRDWNLARECVLGSGLAPQTPAFDLQRACGTSLEAAILIGNKIALGQIDAGIAAGTDTISDTPIVYPDEYRRILLRSHRGRTAGERLAPWLGLRPRHFKPDLPTVVEPRTGLSMGESTEITAKAWGISRQAQDELALASHRNAARAWDSGFHAELVMPWNGVREDNNLRRDTTLEKLAALRPVFDRGPQGTLTAGNSTPLTDGAAAVLLASEDWAAKRGLPVLAWLRYGQVAAVDFVAGEGLLMAPAYAVSTMLQQAGLALQDFDLYEIHEAFAAQALATLKAWESAEFCRERLGRNQPLGAIDRERLNVMGGSLALGHPFAATGARILGALASQLARRGSGRGLVSVCTAGGMGVTAIVER
ncbi:MAG: acetyl-CoA acetyltransferase [Gammaproteobacteria bacterium]|nr:MAG: acetyl-CoA C-acetyltransferase [Pseudomonadota bacterium]MBC6945434.1 acetyl-CoA C-acetyltransferase [Gammaproteobacteria bacterium]MCE7895729.1 acetyl-CoA C-acetyltransferase [Gammaproteobacteria bacterium PRO8]MDL1881121.1 acetyl-CoA C-acetyltransferase [Gammaproteobacteria bacterium PRO2]MCL4776818.1 acetyl-CoA C-acetyltransferase [Gammaproteobacteria bacterium]